MQAASLKTTRPFPLGGGGDRGKLQCATWASGRRVGTPGLGLCSGLPPPGPPCSSRAPAKSLFLVPQVVGLTAEADGRRPPSSFHFGVSGLESVVAWAAAQQPLQPGPRGACMQGGMGHLGTDRKTERHTQRQLEVQTDRRAQRPGTQSPYPGTGAAPPPPASTSLLGGQVDSQGCSHLYYGGRRDGDNL